ncbi:YALIA101S03e15962g1_1 [Yarrowia lipolytica]|nr:Sodium-dependent multivitamin transporter [Yarrowia lipolytica]SEI33340.1 YALIA101S03e15962g1_1 [Yarrowia lipolytica]
MTGYISEPASNAIIYCTLCFFLVMGVVVGYLHMRKQKKENQGSEGFLSANNTKTALPLAINFVASAMGAGTLNAYPDIAVRAGVEGLVVYGLSSALPMMLFAGVGPIVRKACPDGFVLTEWTRLRYGWLTSFYLTCLTIGTMYLYMVAELAAVQAAIETLTGIDALPVLIVEAVFTSIYTAVGGFHTSFFTDNFQGGMMLVLMVIVCVGLGVYFHVDPSEPAKSGMLGPNLLANKLIYILPVAIATNDCFLSGFWMRTFASKNNVELFWACAIASSIVLIVLTVVGLTGLLAVWAKLEIDGQVFVYGDERSALAFFYVLKEMPGWVIGFTVAFVLSLSVASYDSSQSAMASTISNDFFRNKIPMVWVRLIVLCINAPVIVVALKAPNVLNIFLIADLFSAAVIPIMFCGLSKRMYFISGWEVIGGGFGGMLTVFIFGSIYFKSAREGIKLIILLEGLYGDDWSAFGAFVAAPVGSLLWGFGILTVRLTVLKIYSLITGKPFTALDKPSDDKTGIAVIREIGHVEDDNTSESIILDRKDPNILTETHILKEQPTVKEESYEA